MSASLTAVAAVSATSWAGGTTARSTGTGPLGTLSLMSASRRRRVWGRLLGASTYHLSSLSSAFLVVFSLDDAG